MAARKLMFNGLPMPTAEELFGLFLGQATRDMTTGEIIWLNRPNPDDQKVTEPPHEGQQEPQVSELPAPQAAANREACNQRAAPCEETKQVAQPQNQHAASVAKIPQPKPQAKEPNHPHGNGTTALTPREVMALALGQATRDMTTGQVIWLNQETASKPGTTDSPEATPPESTLGEDSTPIVEALKEPESPLQKDFCSLASSPEASLEDVTNFAQGSAGFAGPEQLPEALTALDAADALVLDFETTGLTAYDTPQAPSAAQTIGDTTIKALRAAGCTIDPRPRARVLSLQIPATGYRIAFDLDRLSEPQKASLARATHDKVWIGHNLGFDLAWMLSLHPEVRPRRILDTMLLATTHRPQALYEMQSALIRNQKEQPAIREALWDYVQAKMAKKKDDEESGGALSLQSLSLLYLDESLDKSYQKPHNWMVDRLSEAHWDYCMGDVDTPLRIARKLLDLPDNASVPAILEAMEKNPGETAYRIMEAALPVIARMHHTGVPWSAERAAALDAELAREAQEAAAELLKIAPQLGQPILVPGKASKKDPDPEPCKIIVVDELLSPSKGLTAPVKATLAAAIAQETGRPLQSDPPPGEFDLNSSGKEPDIKLDPYFRDWGERLGLPRP